METMKIIRRVLMLFCFCGGLLFNISMAQAQQISGFVFNDDGNGGGTATNGIKDGTETGLGIGIPIVAYNASTGLCYATTTDVTTGAYALTVGATGTYKY
ncbi:hypothetical protein [Photobacterium carnosum]|uniref:hypothetical protein n=1 Tax=Photobacterium carnosum TaxID=2023717 RepID=UPI00242F173D|nr:hypothetical protein [Photobacterium carnosum]